VGFFAYLTGLVVTAPPAKLAFLTGGTSGTFVAGSTIAPLTVQFLDKANLRVPISGPVTIALTKSNGATLAGTYTVEAHDGVAVFDDLSIAKTGKYTLAVKFGTLKTLTSKSFTIAPDAATSRLVVQFQPANIALDKSLPRMTVTLLDQFNNVVTTDSSSIVNLGIATGPEGAALKGRVAVKASRGVAKFSNIVPLAVGDYTLTVSAGAMTPVTTDPFNVYFVPRKLAITAPMGAGATAGQMLPALVVSILDSRKRVVTTSSAPVTVTLTSPTGAVLHGTLNVVANKGVATFADLSVDVPGRYTLRFASDLFAATYRLTVSL